MRYYDEDEAKSLNAQPWQLELLKANPGYCSWGPHEDYMVKKGDSWESRVIAPTWKDFGPWKLDELNECANFYFAVRRDSKECPTCGGNGYHPQAQEVVNTFYAHMAESIGLPASRAWHDKITEDEARALIDAGRVKPGETAESINAQNRPGARGFGHDAINRSILTEARLKRLGLPKLCPECEGEGHVYTAPAAHVSLVLWWLHPRKGCSRGIEVERIEQADLPAIQAFLMEAAQRNAQRFDGVRLIAPAP